VIRSWPCWTGTGSCAAAAGGGPGVRTGFQEFGLPAASRTDNGVPFASAWALYGLSKLAVWWMRLGIQLERITPGHPEQNGRHERMHLTLKQAATRPAAAVFQVERRQGGTGSGWSMSGGPPMLTTASGCSIS
jgi:transposase InsO family protein